MTHLRSTLAGKRIARLINAILSRTHIAIASVTSPSPMLRLTGQRVLA